MVCFIPRFYVSQSHIKIAVCFSGCYFCQITTGIYASVKYEVVRMSFLELIGIVFFFAVGVILFKKILIISKRASARKKIRELYENNNDIGRFLNDDSYVKAHLNFIKNDIPTARVSVFKIVLPVTNCSTIVEEAKWKAQLGTLDQSSYARAMNAYRIAYNRYENEESRFRAKESAKWSNNPEYRPASWHGSPPKSPSRKDFVNYTKEYGTTHANISHGWRIPINAESLTNLDNQSLISPLSEGVKKAILSIYKDVIEIRLSDDFPYGDIASKVSVDEDCFFELEKNNIYAVLEKNADLGEFYKNFSIYDLDWSFKLLEVKNLPIVVVASYSEANKIKITIHDHLSPDIIIE